MLTPAPTTPIDPRLARGVLRQILAKPGAGAQHVVLAFPNTSYELHLRPTTDVVTPVGKRCVGTIWARAKRIDIVRTGGRYVEPVVGRPRRVQGRVVAIEDDAVVVDAGMPIHCRPTDPRQKATDFAPGQLVSFDVMEGAAFTPAD